jgi:hypothetical protein
MEEIDGMVLERYRIHDMELRRMDPLDEQPVQKERLLQKEIHRQRDLSHIVLTRKYVKELRWMRAKQRRRRRTKILKCKRECESIASRPMPAHADSTDRMEWTEDDNTDLAWEDLEGEDSAVPTTGASVLTTGASVLEMTAMVAV